MLNQLECSLTKSLYLVAILFSQGLISENESSQFKKYALVSSDEQHTLDELVDLFKET